MDLLTLGVQPIAPDQPGGMDIRYGAEFEELQAEIDKLSLPSAARDAIDWQKISDLAATILGEQAKDLLVAAYFGVARIHLDQYSGFQLGLQVVSDLLENFWDTLFPAKKRMRGRLAAVEWWVEKSATALELVKAGPLPEGRKADLHARCARLEQLLADLFPEPPNLNPVTRILNNLAVTSGQAAAETSRPVAEPPAREAPAAVHGTETPPVAGSSPSPSTAQPGAAPVSTAKTPANKGNASVTVQNALQTIHRSVPVLRENDPAGAQSYRLLRIAIWSLVDVLPPATDGKTLIPPPEPQTVAMLRDIHGRGDWSALVQTAETQLSQYIFWLDLNRYSGVALEHLGPPYSAARDTVCRETACLLQRLSGLDRLAFADGTPLADRETLDWLQSVVLGDGPAVTDVFLVDSGSEGAAGDRFSEVFDQARILVKEKKLIEAISLLQQEMQHGFAAKERLRWRLALVRILIISKNGELALPHFDQLIRDIDTYQLERWDPELALTCFKVIRAGLKTVSDKTARQRADAMLHRIARLDPVEALRQGKG